jgi:hypothetical protein
MPEVLALHLRVAHCPAPHEASGTHPARRSPGASGQHTGLGGRLEAAAGLPCIAPHAPGTAPCHDTDGECDHDWPGMHHGAVIGFRAQ